MEDDKNNMDDILRDMDGLIDNILSDDDGIVDDILPTVTAVTGSGNRSNSSSFTMSELSDMLKELGKVKERHNVSGRNKGDDVGYVDIIVPLYVGFDDSGEMMGLIKEAYDGAGEVGYGGYDLINEALFSWSAGLSNPNFTLTVSEDCSVWGVELERHRFNILQTGPGGVSLPCEVSGAGMYNVITDDMMLSPMWLKLVVRCGYCGDLATELLMTAGRFCVTGQGEVMDVNGRQEISSFKIDSLYYHMVDGHKICLKG